MITTTIDSLKWVIDTIRDKQKTDKQLSKENWSRIAKYFDEVAGIMEQAANELENSHAPVMHSAQLIEISSNFRKIVSLVYPEQKSKSNRELQLNSPAGFYYFSLLNALHLIDTGDAILMERSADEEYSRKKQLEIVDDIRRAAGKFKGLSTTIRVMS
jgi:hypothetical protein